MKDAQFECKLQFGQEIVERKRDEWEKLGDRDMHIAVVETVLNHPRTYCTCNTEHHRMGLCLKVCGESLSRGGRGHQ